MIALALALLAAAPCPAAPSLPTLLFPETLKGLAPGAHLWIALPLDEAREPVLLVDGSPVAASLTRYVQLTRQVLELVPAAKLAGGAVSLRLGDVVVAEGELGPGHPADHWRGVFMAQYTERWLVEDDCLRKGPFIVLHDGQVSRLYLISWERCGHDEQPVVKLPPMVNEMMFGDRLEDASLVLGEERAGAEPLLRFDKKHKRKRTLCVRAVNETGHRSAFSRVVFDEAKPMGFPVDEVVGNARGKPRDVDLD